ncbi:MAG TPA: hypothetical protein GX704_03765 [Clostridiales bacterium]|jgi:hypothetical protein|nr:hypothetical protein [Clostridiales bacterium]
MKKKTFRSAAALLALILLMLSFSSCGKSDGVPDGMKLASGDAVDYIMYVPENWVTDISTGATTAYVSENDRSNVSLIAFDLDDPNETAPDFWEKYKDDLISTFPDAVFSEEDNTVIDGSTAAIKRGFTATVTGDPYKFEMVIFNHFGAMYIFTYTATQEKFDLHLEDVGNIIQNIKFK